MVQLPPILWIPGPMPGLTEVIEACKHADHGRLGKRWNAYAELKKAWSNEIDLYARQRRMAPITTKCFCFMFVEKDKRRDPDNFISGGMKLIFDGLQKAKLLQNDGWSHVDDIKPYWTVDVAQPGVLLIMTRAPIETFAMAFSIYQAAKGVT